MRRNDDCTELGNEQCNYTKNTGLHKHCQTNRHTDAEIFTQLFDI